MYIHSPSLSSEPHNISRPANPNPYTAACFESPLQQQSAQLDTSHMTTDSTHYYASLLHTQLALTSNMCSELLHTQNSLVGAVCSHLEAFGCQAGMQQQLSAMAQYQRDLEQYYQELHRSYVEVRCMYKGEWIRCMCMWTCVENMYTVQGRNI